VVIVVVAVVVAAVAGTALVMAAHHDRETVSPQAQLSVQNGQFGVQNGQSGQGWQGGGQGWNGGNGMNGGASGSNGGYRWNDGNGSGRRMGAAGMMGRGGWQPLRGLPWLVLGLLIGAGVTLLIWQPWKQRTLAPGPAGAAGEGDAQTTADQWAQWHRGLHEADEATMQPPATPAVDVATEPDASAETTAELPAEPKTPAEPDPPA
jgi:hypothetical protein